MERDHGITVLVLAPGGDQLTRTLDALAAQEGVPRFDVVVADRASTASGEWARSHPLVTRVVLGVDTVPGSLVGRSLWSLHEGAVAVLPAGAEPEPRWLVGALGALATGPEVVWAPCGAAEGIVVDIGAARAAGLLRFGAKVQGDSAGAVRRWATAAGLWIVDVRRLTDRSDGCTPIPRHVVSRSAPAATPHALITIAVCSHGRPEGLQRCLASLDGLDDDCYEVIVIDNGPVPQYPSAEIEARGARYVHEPRPGLDCARNRAVAEAAGSIVAFIDDDCEATSSWITDVRDAFDDGDVACVTGRVVPASLARPSERWFEAWFTFDRGTAPDRFTRDDERVALYPSLLGTGANMAFRRSALDVIGGFDELLDVGSGIGGGGDLDIFARLLDAGCVAAYAPGAVVVHHHRTDMAALRKQFFGYGQALGALCVKYALGREGHKRAAFRFFWERLRDHRRRAVRRLRGRSELPLTLTLLEAGGQVHGSLSYLRSRRAAARR